MLSEARMIEIHLLFDQRIEEVDDADWAAFYTLLDPPIVPEDVLGRISAKLDVPIEELRQYRTHFREFMKDFYIK